VVNYSRGNDLATIKNSLTNIFWPKFLVGNYSRGNDFATIKNFRPNNFFGKNF
jgi:hypothetical protein